MSRPPKPLRIGARSGRLTVAGLRDGVEGSGRIAVCICDCGNTKTVPSRQFGQKFKSCGCAQAPNQYDLEGTARTLDELAAMSTVPRGTIRDRLARGWPARRAITEPPGRRPGEKWKKTSEGSHVG